MSFTSKAIVVFAVVLRLGSNATSQAQTTTNAARANGSSGHQTATASPARPLEPSPWTRTDRINLAVAIGSLGYLVATIVIIGLMYRANRIAHREAERNFEMSRAALDETRRSNDLTHKGVEAAAETVRLTKQQLDSSMLDKYLPIQAGVSAALASIRVCKELPLNVPFQLGNPQFTRAVHLSETIGGTLQSSLRAVEKMFEPAQAYRDDMIKATVNYPPGDLPVEANRKFMLAYLNTAEAILQAAYDEIAPRVTVLRESTGRPDVTLASFGDSLRDMAEPHVPA